VYTLHTAGWPSNEYIIEAMHSNVLWWGTYWVSSFEHKRGGRYVFEVKEQHTTKGES
jgi:hypothetical protein